jgi:hypothetical protein
MKHYDSIPRIQDDGTLNGEMVWGFNKLDGQNFCATFKTKANNFVSFGSRTVQVDEHSESELAEAVTWFKVNKLDEKLIKIIKDNWKKGDVFQGIEEITFFFEWYGPNSFAGKHDFWDYANGDMRLALIDVFLKKKGYMEPKDYYTLFKDSGIEIPDLIYRGPLNSEIISKIQNNDWTQPDAEFPNVKEGVVFKRSTLMKGQRRPSVKVKTKWWLNKLHSMYSEEECKKLE